MKTISRRQFMRQATVAGVGLAHVSSCMAPLTRSTPGQTGLFYDEACLRHPTVGSDSPERLRWIHERLTSSGLLEKLVPLMPLSLAETRLNVLRVHSQEALESLDACVDTGPTALLAVAGVLGAVRAVALGRVKNAFCAIRPPGHHAHDNPDNDGSCRGQGFCFLSNAAIAARYAQAAFGFKNILIVDWDYHHGNGTQDVFYDDPTVFFFSTHDFHAYPGSGDPALRGEGAGSGFNLNVHLDCGSTDEVIFEAFETGLFPALETVAFTPDLILISAGFDSKINDQLGCFAVTPQGFSSLTARLMVYADQKCEGRIVSMLEGGYADRTTGNTWDGLASCVESHIKTLYSTRG
jgi:acetoin utilization deacetylase AcuC-like enzyme